MKRILLATDFSSYAQAGLAHAVRFAEVFNAELHLLNIQVPYGPTSPLLEEFPGDADARAELEDIEIGHARVVRAVAHGIAAAPAILEYAEEHEIDMIVMGSHGRRGVRRLLLGSVTEEVLRAGSRPVLTVHQRAESLNGPLAYGRMLVPVDFSVNTAKQVETAADLAARFGAVIDMVHIIDPPVVPELYMPVAPFVVDVKEATEKAVASLEGIAAPLREGLTVETDILVGGSVHEILRRAKGADLVIMPTHGYSGFDRILMGSVTEGVLRRASCPVLVLKTGEAGGEAG